MAAGIDARSTSPRRLSGEGDLTTAIGGGWVVFDDIAGFDLRTLTVEQTRRIAPFVVHAAWRRGLADRLALVHGGRRDVLAELRRRHAAGDWAGWARGPYSKRHGIGRDALVLALWPHEHPSPDALPDLEPGCPRRAASPTRSTAGAAARPAAADRPYCDQHDPQPQGGDA